MEMAESMVIVVSPVSGETGAFAMTSGSFRQAPASSVQGLELRTPLGSGRGDQLIPWYGCGVIPVAAGGPASGVDLARTDQSCLVREHDRLRPVAELELVEEV